jgi:LmbE family N-acetylglucosaminyl deacetylase
MWQVFYTPHTDDETIGMAGAIARARASGDDVLVVLVTDNRPSARGHRLFPDVEDVHEQRRKEWQRAMQTLDVTATETWELPEEHCSTEPFRLQNMIELRMQDVHDRLSPRHHHTVWGLNDLHVDSMIGSLSHGICASALARLAYRTPGLRATLYGVYIYSRSLRERYAPMIVTLTDREFALKRMALECYKAGPNSIGYGYSSVPELIDHALVDAREFIVELTNG